MGEVFEAFDTVLEGELVALKILREELCSDERHAKRFLREVQLTRKVTSPCVVRTFDAGRVGTQLYFTMELVEGHTLKEHVQRQRLNWRESLEIVLQIAEGIAAIHEAGIIHRDLKPSNVIVTDSGVVKIADFGVARPGESDLTGQHEVVGSTPYMAPEVWLGRDVGPAADLYALGVLWFWLLTNELPFDAASAAEAMTRHLQYVPVPPHVSDPQIPEWVSATVMLLLRKEPAERPNSARKLAAQLRELLHEDDPTTKTDLPQVEDLSESVGYFPEGITSLDESDDWAVATGSALSDPAPALESPELPAEAVGIGKSRAGALGVFGTQRTTSVWWPVLRMAGAMLFVAPLAWFALLPALRYLSSFPLLGSEGPVSWYLVLLSAVAPFAVAVLLAVLPVAVCVIGRGSWGRLTGSLFDAARVVLLLVGTAALLLLSDIAWSLQLMDLPFTRAVALQASTSLLTNLQRVLLLQPTAESVHVGIIGQLPAVMASRVVSWWQLSGYYLMLGGYLATLLWMSVPRRVRNERSRAHLLLLSTALSGVCIGLGAALSQLLRFAFTTLDEAQRQLITALGNWGCVTLLLGAVTVVSYVRSSKPTSSD